MQLALKIAKKMTKRFHRQLSPVKKSSSNLAYDALLQNAANTGEVIEAVTMKTYLYICEK